MEQDFNLSCDAKQVFLTTLGMPEMGLLAAKVKWDHFKIETFATLVLQSGLKIALGHKKVFSLGFLLLSRFPLKS